MSSSSLTTPHSSPVPGLKHTSLLFTCLPCAKSGLVLTNVEGLELDVQIPLPVPVSEAQEQVNCSQ